MTKHWGFFWSTCLTALLGTLGISYLLEVKHTKVLLSMRKSTVPNKQAEETKGGQETFHNLYTEIHLMILVPQRQVGESWSKKVSPLLVPKETSLTQDKLKWIAQTALSSRDVKEAEMQLLCQVFSLSILQDVQLKLVTRYHCAKYFLLPVLSRQIGKGCSAINIAPPNTLIQK